MAYTQVGNTKPEYRNEWVIEKIKTYAKRYPGGSFFDVGAGSSPYKNVVSEAGLRYQSQDFNMYKASLGDPGNHTENWNYAEHDFICDILDIPDDVNSDITFCSEVLEHVPNTVLALKKLAACTKESGIIIVTVPFISLMHQAPYWFQSGLSPFWFEYWAKEFELEVVEITVQGDYVDLVHQDFSRLMQGTLLHRILLRILNRLHIFEKSRKFMKSDITSSGGCGTLVILHKRS